MSEDKLGPFSRVYLEFILRRVVHDLGNSVSGINSLSDYHLRSGITDPGLEESLRLIRESAELSRELLVGVGEILQPAETEEELVQVQKLIEEAAKIVSLLLPRSVKFETIGPKENTAVISVLRGDFLRKVLSLVAMDLCDLRVPSGTIQLGCENDGKKARLFYCSIVQPASRLHNLAPALLANVSRSVEITGSADGDRFILTMTFPLVELFEGQR